MQNLYQIKRAGELVATEIPQNCGLLLKSVGSNLKGTAIAAIVSDELADAATQMAALYPFMKQLVTSGSYDTGGSDGGKEKHKGKPAQFFRAVLHCKRGTDQTGGC